MTVALISHRDCRLHETGADQPERPERLSAVEDALVVSGLDLVVRHYEAPAASREQLCWVHDAAYVNDIFARAPREGLVWLAADTAMNPHTLQAALHAAGAVLLGVDLVMEGKAGVVFCNVRPPGHHAERARTSGFCIFNNVAVGAAHALRVHGLERVAIVDFDVHHGNGTEDIFRDDPRILFCSTYQEPYLHGDDAPRSIPGHIINVPLGPGSDGRVFREAVEAHWLEALARFSPQLLLISAGFDAHLMDQISHLRLRERDYAWLTEHLKQIADAHAGGRIVSVLEGGYSLPALGRSVAAHMDALLGNHFV